MFSFKQFVIRTLYSREEMRKELEKIVKEVEKEKQAPVEGLGPEE